jgi:hypothetical protein
MTIYDFLALFVGAVIVGSQAISYFSKRNIVSDWFRGVKVSKSLLIVTVIVFCLAVILILYLMLISAIKG